MDETMKARLQRAAGPFTFAELADEANREWKARDRGFGSFGTDESLKHNPAKLKQKQRIKAAGEVLGILAESLDPQDAPDLFGEVDNA